MRRIALVVVSVMAVAGCGSHERRTIETVTVTTAETSQNEAAVHIYFCTSDTCAKEATRAQMDAIMRRASASSLVQKVVFVSKEQSLKVMRDKHPEEVAALPTNPFPNVLNVTPKRPEDAERIADLFPADPAHGVDKVDYWR
jgi:cell division protein FtsX